MIFLQRGLYVVIEQLETDIAPVPKPLSHGFSKGVAYLALGAFSLSESGEAFLILSNDDDEIWFISNRHLRTHRLLPESNAFRMALNERPRPLEVVAGTGRNGGTKTSSPERPA